MMNYLNENVKDLILNEAFRKWVLTPDFKSERIWRNSQSKDQVSAKEVEEAKKIVLDLFSDQYPLQPFEFDQMWQNIDSHTVESTFERGAKRISPTKPLPHSGKQQNFKSTLNTSVLTAFLRVAVVLLFLIGIGYLILNQFQPNMDTERSAISSVKSYQAAPGIKSSITLQDGTKVLLNSGSVLTYNDNLDLKRREVYLEGEAFFDVFPNSEKPLTVTAGGVSTTAIGTSFNIKAYEKEDVKVALITGKVAVGIPKIRRDSILLKEKEVLKIPHKNGKISKVTFDEDEVLGWTRKLIVFDNTTFSEAIRVLENWYGVSFEIDNMPKEHLNISGKFQDETLKNVMEGLKHTLQIEYSITGEKVTIEFNNQRNL
ncbi:FecR domain-containing protein [uncultured Cyclobacterium sp.]|uniref:FecR family protein n=1 Tax=uncultured Cyclobacterium sp. TaxID=453820 RepID=UPI0030EF4F72